MMISISLIRVQNIVGKGENASYQQFLIFPYCFAKPFSCRLLKIKIVWQDLINKAWENNLEEGENAVTKVMDFEISLKVHHSLETE